jgi:hypothetical protein
MDSVVLQAPISQGIQWISAPAWPPTGCLLAQGTAIWDGGNLAAWTVRSILQQSALDTSGSLAMYEHIISIVACPEEQPDLLSAKNAAAIQLLNSWLADDSGYDERVWPIVKKAVEDNRTSLRGRFSE